MFTVQISNTFYCIASVWMFIHCAVSRLPGHALVAPARGSSHFPHIIASGHRFICMRAADQDPLQPLWCYLINRHESYGALVFLNYIKHASTGKIEYLGNKTEGIDYWTGYSFRYISFIWGGLVDRSVCIGA